MSGASGGADTLGAMPNSQDLSEHRVGMLLDHPGRHPDEILDRLRGALGHGNVGEPDHEGFFEVGVAAASFESALEVVWNAVASAGVDDDVRFAEHPDLPEHWRRRAGGGA